MFTLTANPVTFVGLLILFGWSILWSLRDVVRATTLVQRISSLIHLVMAATMLAMVPRSWWHLDSSGYTVVVVLYAVFTAWMLAMALWRPSWAAWGHVGMFAAMVWHLSAMRTMHRAMSSMTGTAMGGMGHDMKSGMGGSGHMTGSMSALHSYAMVGIPLMLVLLAIAVVGARRAITGRPEHPAHAPLCHVVATSPMTARLSGLADLAMGFGMAWMSTGLVAPILPFMGHLHP